MSSTIRSEVGDVASGNVRVCVAPAVHVQGVGLAGGSTVPLTAFDEAVMRSSRVADFEIAWLGCDRLETAYLRGRGDNASSASVKQRHTLITMLDAAAPASESGSTVNS